MPTLKHTAVLLEMCDKQRTVTTTKLRREILRLDGQAARKLDKNRKRHDLAITNLNRRAQLAETKVVKLEKELAALRKEAKQ